VADIPIVYDKIMDEALAAGAIRKDVTVGSRAARRYWFAVKGLLLVLAYILILLILHITTHGWGWQQLLERLTDGATVALVTIAALIAYGWNKIRRDERPSVGRLSLAVVTAMNALYFELLDEVPEDEDTRDRPIFTPANWAGAVGISRKKLRDAAYTIAVQQAVLAGWSADDYLDERWSRLARVLIWAGHSPHDRKVRGMMLLACSMCLGKADDEHMLDPLDITIPNIYTTDLEAAKRSRFKIRSILSRITSPDNVKIVFTAVVTGLVTMTIPQVPALGGWLTSLWGHLWGLVT
jgi:hypothetical protein